MAKKVTLATLGDEIKNILDDYENEVVQNP